MATTITATPLADLFGIRLRVASFTAPPVLSVELGLDDTPSGQAAAQAEVAAWTVTGNHRVSVQSTWSQPVLPLLGISTTSTTLTGDARRTVTGLSVGQRYRLSLIGEQESSGATLGVLGIGSRPMGNRWEGLDPSQREAGPWVYEFVATATSHVIVVTGTYASGGGGGVFIRVRGLTVAPIPAPLSRFETEFPSSEDASWTRGGATHTGTSAASHDAGANRMLRMGWTRTTGVMTLTPFGNWLQRTVTGLTVGQRYTVRAYAYGIVYDSSNSSAPHRPRIALGVLGMSFGTPAYGNNGLPSFQSSGSDTQNQGTWLTYTFTATATSHVVQLAFADGVTTSGAASAVADLGLSYLRVDYIPSGPVRTLVSITRTDSNGARPVRLGAGQQLSDGVLYVTDYETALTGLVRYDVVVAEGAAREAATVSLPGGLGATVARLAPATLPQFAISVPLIERDTYTADRLSSMTVHQVIGRPDLLVTMGPLGSRTGSLSAVVSSHPQALALQAVYERGEVVLWRQPDVPGLDMYHVASRTRLTPAGGSWRLSVDYIEQAVPSGPLLGATGWTFDAALTALPTFLAASAAYRTFNDYTTGPS